MFKNVLVYHGAPALCLGLLPQNVAWLKAGRPAAFRGRAVGLGQHFGDPAFDSAWIAVTYKAPDGSTLLPDVGGMVVRVILGDEEFDYLREGFLTVFHEHDGRRFAVVVVFGESPSEVESRFKSLAEQGEKPTSVVVPFSTGPDGFLYGI